MTREEMTIIARALRDARPIRLDDPLPDPTQIAERASWLSADIVYTNCCKEVAEALRLMHKRFDSAEFLSTCKVRS